MSGALRQLFAIMPFLFGIGFIAPLIAQLLIAFQITDVAGISPLVVGLVIGAAWGLYANKKGRWI